LYNQQMVVIDALRETVPPFSPEQVVGQYADLLKSYHLSAVTADRYAGQWVVEQFGKFGILCVQAAKPKSDLYADTLALLNSRRIELLDHPRCLSQLTALERRTSRGGRDTIDHPPNAHDDVANAAAGVASLCISSAGYNLDAMAATDPDYGDPTPAEVYRKKRLHPQFDDGLSAHHAAYQRGGAAMILYNDKQRAVLEQIAATLPPIARPEFLHFVSTQVNEAPTDGKLEAAIRFALDRVTALPFLVAAPHRSLPDDHRRLTNAP
jgi:hypothetical protein